MVEMDAKGVVDAFNSSLEDRSEFGSIIDLCRSYYSSFSNVCLTYASRQCNVVAHSIAKAVFTRPDIQEGILIPHFVRSLAANDILLR